MDKVVVLQSIKKIYPIGDAQIEVLKNVSLAIYEGEFVAIVGPSGSGKSTLMHIIGLLDKPTSGEVILVNRNVSSFTETELAELRNKYIGFVFQFFNLLPRTSAIDNVILPLTYSKVPQKEWQEKAKAMLDVVGLSQRIYHTPSQLSGGQQQRVAIARALINNPKIILADEPTGNLDSKSGQEIINIFKKLNKEGNTIVLVTHEPDIAKQAKRIIEVKDGEIIRDTKV
ncbi:MAG: ABC transporter ATP-binding protein [Patescibacteria group bacterium]|nr:ABC transporter ATP-binding protein [Patescibacteria group bacterium]